MRGMADESVDLIYLDPPFNSNHDYAAPIGTPAGGAEFKDTWTLQDVDLAWWGEIAESYPALYKVLEATRETAGKSMMSYLIYMAVRIIEMHRILRETGSLYLHCDPTASHYLKLALDSVLGKSNFVNEVVWYKGYRGTPRKQRYQQEHDTVFLYAKQYGRYTWNSVFGEYKDKSMSRYNKIDKDGKKYALIKRRRTDGTVYYGKTYPKGKLQGDVVEIPVLAATDKERTGYPTQKPLALLERIIKASSNQGDMVLDPFCGCATACHAAERLNRQWIGIDISEKAAQLVQMRINRDITVAGAGGVIHRTDIPQISGMRTKNIKHVLYGMQEGRCKGCCGHYNFKDLEVDHVIPRAKGGQDVDENLQLLCGHCNRVKGGKLTMAELNTRLKEMGMATC